MLWAVMSTQVLGQDGPEERFKNTEIRVIRPRYFQKAKRLELGGAVSGVMNETFIYTYLASGLLTYHFSEFIAVSASAALGVSIDKEDKRILFDEFEIKTKIFRTAYHAEASLELTPLYGKWQLPSGRLIYFDTFVTAGGGISGITWKYSDFCTDPDLRRNPSARPIPSDATKAYPTFLFGLGQRYFVKRDVAYRWDIKTHGVVYDRIDSECDPELAASDGIAGSGQHFNITLQVGASKYL